MTVAAKSATVLYTDNGVTTKFAAPYRFKNPTDLVVERVTADGAATRLRYGVDYSVSGGTTDAGGTVTIPVPVVFTKIRIRRATPLAQASEYATGDRFPAKLTEGGLDTSMLIDQEQAASIADVQARTPAVPIGETMPLMPAFLGRRQRLPFWADQGEFAAMVNTIPGDNGIVTLDVTGRPVVMSRQALYPQALGSGDFDGGYDGIVGNGQDFEGGFDGQL